MFFLVYRNLIPDVYRDVSTPWEAVEVLWVHRIAPARAPRDHRRCVGDLCAISEVFCARLGFFSALPAVMMSKYLANRRNNPSI